MNMTWRKIFTQRREYVSTDAIGNGMIFRHQDMSEEPNSR